MTAQTADQWFEAQMAARKYACELSEGHRRCLRILAATITHPSGLYNLPTAGALVDSISLWPGGAVAVLLRGELATFDNDQLTRLVLAAHQDLVRVAVRPWLSHQDEGRAQLIARHLCSEYGEDDRYIAWDDPTVGHGVMEVTLHPRQASGRRHERHPGLTDLAVLAEKPRCGQTDP